MTQQLERDGFEIVRTLIDQELRTSLTQSIQAQIRTVPSAGVRGLAEKLSAVRDLAESKPVRELVSTRLSGRARLVRSILFNKSQHTNWQVAWHQDLSIAVRAKCDLEGYGPWSMKDGIVHVQPPVAVLQQMLTVRIHLDRADATNGALCVAPGSHRKGRIKASDAASVARESERHLCVVEAGDALLFKPLLLHASRKATSDAPRRVIHLEFAAVDLPPPLQWSDAA